MTKRLRTTRAITEMRKRNYVPQNVEKYNQYSKTKNDLYGLIDILCMNKESPYELIGLQVCCMGTDLQNHIDKATNEDHIGNLTLWLSSPNRKFIIQAWDKRGPRGKRKLWTYKEIEITLDNNKLNIEEL